MRQIFAKAPIGARTGHFKPFPADNQRDPFSGPIGIGIECKFFSGQPFGRIYCGGDHVNQFQRFLFGGYDAITGLPSPLTADGTR